MKPPLPPMPPHLLPLRPNNPFLVLTREMFCDHCQRTQVIVNDLREEMRFILNHILERLDVLSKQGELAPNSLTFLWMIPSLKRMPPSRGSIAS
ncbi:hypothetical protein Tco_0517956 [Tanacetum coccineum]